MAVDEHVDAADLGQQIHRAVGGGGGLVVNAQVTQADDDVRALVLQGLHLGGGHGVQLLAAGELHALDLGGMGFGGGLRGVQAEHADLGAVGGGEHKVVTEGQLVVVGDVGGQDGEVGGCLQLLQVGIAIVKLMVAGGRHVVAHHVHQLDGRGALADADIGLALAEVAGVHHQDVGALGLVLCLQGGHFGISLDGAVYVVGVQDNGGAGQIGTGRPGILRGKRRHSQPQHHDQGQQQGEQLLFHINSTFP